MKYNKKYQELFNALLIKYGIEPDEEWTNIEWKILIDSKLDTKQRDLFYNELVNLDLNYKGWTHHRSTQEEIKEDMTKKVETEEEFARLVEIAEETIDFFAENALEHERTGEMIDRIGLVNFLEGIGVQLFDRVDGDFFTVLGLPLTPLLGALRKAGTLDQ